jgi:hypothetical protein
MVIVSFSLSTPYVPLLPKEGLAGRILHLFFSVSKF